MVATDVVAIKETTKELKDAMEKVQVRLGAAEQRISDIEDMNTRVEKVIEKHDKKLETLWSRVEDLENRSRRNNVRMVGLKENKEQRGSTSRESCRKDLVSLDRNLRSNVRTAPWDPCLIRTKHRELL